MEHPAKTKRIIFLTDQPDKYELLFDSIRKNYHLLPYEAGLDQDFDLSILDWAALKRLEKDLQARKELEKPLFLPLLLIVSRQDVKMITGDLRNLTDELIFCPLESLELHTRIEALLRARSFSIELKEIREELYRTKGAALCASLVKKDCLAYIGRKIRTPLNGLVSMLDFLKDTELSARQEKFLRTACSSSDILLTAVNDIRDFLKLDGGELAIDNIDFDLRKTVKEIIDTEQVRAEEKKLTIASFIHRNVPVLLKGDPERLGQILRNLINNAVKFTGKGEILVRVIQEEETETHVRLSFSVIDTGRGIDQEKKTLLIQFFSRSDGFMTGNYGETGLGLAFSGKLVKMMGGYMNLESEEGKGSTFWFILPFEKCKKDEIPPETLPEKKERDGPSPCEEENKSSGYEPEQIFRENKLRILLAEDNIASQVIAQIILEKIPCIVDLVGNGRDVISSLEQNSYDLLLLDLQMPEIDGIETAGLIREKEKTTGGRMPIIAMTAYGMEIDRAFCLKAGMDDYISKPVQADVFLNTIAGVLKRKLF